MSPSQISNFLDGAIRNRISVRLIAEQHIALSQALNNPNNDPCHVGVVNTQCSPKATIHMCSSYVSELCEATLGVKPPIVIDGHVDATFAYVTHSLVLSDSVNLYASQQLCTSSSRVHDNGNSQKCFSRYCRTSPESIAFPYALSSSSSHNPVAPFTITSYGLTTAILFYPDT
jgi:Mitochondrial branched-chain alpha-ketoacid dehydrogenase kinase